MVISLINVYPIRHSPAPVSVWARWHAGAELAQSQLSSAWTDGGKLRHASYKGMRDDAEMGDIYEVSAGTKSGSAAP